MSWDSSIRCVAAAVRQDIAATNLISLLQYKTKLSLCMGALFATTESTADKRAGFARCVCALAWAYGNQTVILVYWAVETGQ